MSKSKRTVTSRKKENLDRLPDWAAEGAVIVEWLDENGLLDGLGERLRIQREGGYVGLDLVLFLLFFFTAGVPGGLKGFNERAAPHRRQLAGLGDRRRFASRSSVSRVLGAVETRHGEELAEWLLFDGCGASSVMEHPSTKTLDTHGEAWQVFDLDPTTTVLRQRALPEGEDLPAPRRRSNEAAPGYTGRKRGDVQLSRMTLQHAGSALWLGLWLAPGNGDWRRHSEAAVETVGAVCDKLHHARERALVRVDGAGGNVPFIAKCQEVGVCYLTRWSQYGVLDEAALREHLNSASWFDVVDSRSGPRRQAAEIGTMELQPADSTRRADGSSYSTVRSRLVVSRFRAKDADKKRGTGILIGGWQYELYATDLAPEAWPAPEVVTTYYGRTGEENRFAQEDRELGLDRIFSYNVAGQQLANLVGLFVWNLRICRGMELANPPGRLPPQGARTVSIAKNVPELIVDRATPAEEVTEARAPGDPLIGPDDNPPPQPAHIAMEAICPPQPTPPCSQTEEVPTVEHVVPPTRSAARIALIDALGRLDWADLLEDRAGWSWSPKTGGLLCPAGSLSPLRAVTIRGLDRTRTLRFLTASDACGDCALRSGCTASKSKVYRKEVAVVVPTRLAYALHALHAKSKGQEAPPPPRPTPPRKRQRRRPLATGPKPLQVPVPERLSAPKSMLQTWRRLDGETQEGKNSFRPPVLLPARLRQGFSLACRGIEVHVKVRAPHRQKRITVFAMTACDRQHRRLTWAQRHRWNEFPTDGHIHVEFADGDGLAPVLRRIRDEKLDENAA